MEVENPEELARGELKEELAWKPRNDLPGMAVDCLRFTRKGSTSFWPPVDPIGA